jgi:aminoglycoside phosphotransferase (APT) family kinase protein
VPHPVLIAACPAEDVIGAAFYLMEPIDGCNASVGLPALMDGTPPGGRAVDVSEFKPDGHWIDAPRLWDEINPERIVTVDK